MTYEEALAYIHAVNWTFCKPGLERIAALCEALGNPQEGLRCVHVAGTNGKGSFCAMTAAVLRAAGLKVGLFTSPYIKTFNERMQINGEPIADDELATLVDDIRPVVDAMADKPTEFELITAVAFMYFRRHRCDVVVLEAGMGGRLDSTNIIREPLLSVITGVALDHTAFLGDTVAAIAGEKAGIIKAGRPVLLGGTDETVHAVVAQAAADKHAPLTTVAYTSLAVKAATLDGTVLDYGRYTDVRLSLLGTYQPLNAAAVLCAVELLRAQGLCIPDTAVYEGLATVTWPARFELLRRDPPILFDGAHNAQGIDAAVVAVKHYFGDDRVYVVTGVLQDKDYTAIAERLGEIACRAFVLTPDNPRALAGEAYAALLEECGVPATAYPSAQEAYAAAVAAADADRCPLVCLGSLYTYAAITT